MALSLSQRVCAYQLPISRHERANAAKTACLILCMFIKSSFHKQSACGTTATPQWFLRRRLRKQTCALCPRFSRLMCDSSVRFFFLLNQLPTAAAADSSPRSSVASFCARDAETRSARASAACPQREFGFRGRCPRAHT